MWNFLSPFWEKIVALLCDKLQPKVKQIYGKLSKKNKRIITCIIIIIAVVFIISNIIYNSSKTNLTIVDVEICEVKGTTVDINFTIKNNNPNSDRYIRQVVLHIKDYYEMSYDNTLLFFRLEPSYTYEVIIIGDNLPENQIIEMSQVVPAGGFDSFVIKVASCEDNIFREILTKLDFEFICDNGEKIKTDECILALGCNVFDERALEMQNDIWRSIYDNYLALKRFNSYKCRYKMDEFIDIFNSYQKYENTIMEIGKKQYELDMLCDNYKIDELNCKQLLKYLLYVFKDFESIDFEELNDGYLFTINFKFNDNSDKIDTIYFSSDKYGKILSIYIPAKTDDLDFTPIVFCNEIIELVDPSIDRYWYNQRIVDLNYHKGLRFWDDKNIYAEFVEYKEKNMMKINLK